MKHKMDYEHLADALSQAIKSYNCCDAEILDGCRFELLSLLEQSIRSLQLSLSVLLNSYKDWHFDLGLSYSTISRFESYLRFNPVRVRLEHEKLWWK